MSDEFKAKVDTAGEEVKESAKDGAKTFLDDAQRVKDSAEHANAEHKAEKAEKKAAKRAKFNSHIEALKASWEEGTEEASADSAVLFDSIKDILEDAGVEFNEDNAVTNAFKELKESFAQGIEDFKSDMHITKDAIGDVDEDSKAKKAAKKAARSKKFDDAVATLKAKLDD